VGRRIADNAVRSDNADLWHVHTAGHHRQATVATTTTSGPQPPPAMGRRWAGTSHPAVPVFHRHARRRPHRVTKRLVT
jgi:hypothetical protein